MIVSRLIALFVLVPIIELCILLEIGKNIGIFFTITLVIFTGIIGAYLVKNQGCQMNSGMIPTDSLIEGLLVLIGGIFLITPGLMTDIIGFLLVIPPSRLFKIREHGIYDEYE